MKDKFNSYPWHDAELLWFNIDRTNEKGDSPISFEVRWIDGQQTIFIFDYCFKLNVEMNLNFEGFENIFEAYCSDENDEIYSIVRNWSNFGLKLENLLYFRINTNTTNSLFEIYAKTFSVKNV